MTDTQIKTIYDELETKQRKLDNKQKWRVKNMLRRQDINARIDYDYEHTNGYCKKCHCLIRLNGICDICG